MDRNKRMWTGSNKDSNAIKFKDCKKNLQLKLHMIKT